ncbi:MAG TPA: S8 family serine peptidase [Bryobacteraceae bacterium]|nr:S8 family serine peptidase [Bryobacteraceae bacterium]
MRHGNTPFRGWRAWPVLFFLAAGPVFAQVAANRYALILEDPPVSSRISSKEAMQSTTAKSYAQQIAAKQRLVRTELASRNIRVTGSADTLLNAVFVAAPKDRVAELSALPGVVAVIPVRRYRRSLDRATQLMDAPAAWNALGGAGNAGKGIKIGILDSGIDQTHPAFQDSSLPMPAGYPKCSGSDCAFTSNKVIVARSYVRQLAAGSSASNPAADSRPDDYSPRDRGGHGTAVASCAAGETNTGAVTITGMAPKAYLGNYKIYGSPEVNDFTTDDVIIQALEDAIKDGMDIVSFSSGGPALTGPLDAGTACGNSAGVACDLSAQAFETAAKNGLVIVAAAGNDGQSGSRYPTFNSIESPADAPSVIAAGATTNSHVFSEGVSVPGADAPSTLQGLAAQAGDALVPPGAVTAPLRDVSQLGDDGLACASLPAGSLAGAFALIERGTCTFASKMINAQNAGAVGVIFYLADASRTTPSGLFSFNIPAVMISNSDGLALKSFVNAHPDHPVTIDPAGIELDAGGSDRLAAFSSMGPSTGDSLIKPDVLATGTNMYIAAQSYDPLGELFSTNGYAVANGTSFATPLVSGAAALVKQSHPKFTAAQIKSALVNTTASDVSTDNRNQPVSVQSAGAGKLDAGAAVQATVTANPATVSFGILNPATLPLTKQIQMTNSGGSSVTLSVAVAPGQSGGGTVAAEPQSLTLAAGASGTIQVTLSGAMPPAGSYSGFVTLTGGGVALRIPYLYLVGDGNPDGIIPLTGDNFDGTAGQPIPDGVISFKLVDQYGVPIVGAPVTFTARGGAMLQQMDSATNAYGIAQAEPVLGSQPGSQSIVATAGGLRHVFSGSARVQPTIAANGVVNAASFDASSPVAPGSYISIFGTGLSDTTDSTSSATLPLAIDYVNVSFDVPSANLSVPGRLIYVSPGQVNVQVPWELQGQSAAQVKVTIDYSAGTVVTTPLANYSPALFETASGVAAALDAQNQVITASHPARRGETVQLFANGLGPVTNQPASGAPAPASPLAQTTTLPMVTIGGQAAAVSFAGLAPGFAGLYQINVTVPGNLSAGNQPVTVAIGGKTSKASGIAVQ